MWMVDVEHVSNIHTTTLFVLFSIKGIGGPRIKKTTHIRGKNLWSWKRARERVNLCFGVKGFFFWDCCYVHGDAFHFFHGKLNWNKRVEALEAIERIPQALFSNTHDDELKYNSTLQCTQFSPQLYCECLKYSYFKPMICQPKTNLCFDCLMQASQPFFTCVSGLLHFFLSFLPLESSLYR